MSRGQGIMIGPSPASPLPIWNATAPETTSTTPPRRKNPEISGRGWAKSARIATATEMRDPIAIKTRPKRTARGLPLRVMEDNRRGGYLKLRLEVVDRLRELLVRLDLSARLQQFAREEPVHGREGAPSLVVRRNHEVHEPQVVVRVAQSDDGDADVHRFLKRLLVRRGVRDEDDRGLRVLHQVRVRHRARHEPARVHLGPDRLREQPRGLLPVLPRRHDQDLLRREFREEFRRDPEARVRLLDVEDVQSVRPHHVDERLHARALLLRPDVDAAREVRVLRHQQSFRALFLRLHAYPPRDSSMRMSSLSFAIRSPPTAPVLIANEPNATARWAIVSSVVSPLRCDITVRYPASFARATVARVSVSVPIWFGLIRIAFAAPSRIPRASRSGFVANRSSPTTTHADPTRSVSRAYPAKSS